MVSQAWYLGLVRLGHWTVQCCLDRYQRCKLLASQALVILWHLIRAVVLIIYKLLVISYRLTIGRMKTKEEETTVPDLIRANNYEVRLKGVTMELITLTCRTCQVETHNVLTDDGYCLQLHRIPGKGKPVLLIHGMMCSSYCWVVSDDSSLAFILADAGYDVWMGNFRGTRYSRKHQDMDPDRHRAFWRFSLHELGTGLNILNIIFLLIRLYVHTCHPI